MTVSSGGPHLMVHETSGIVRPARLDDIEAHLRRLGFDHAHTVDLSEDSWGIEHPVSCALNRLDLETMEMRSLRDVCELWQAFDQHGLADRFLEERGPGRFSVSDLHVRELMERLEDA